MPGWLVLGSNKPITEQRTEAGRATGPVLPSQSSQMGREDAVSPSTLGAPAPPGSWIASYSSEANAHCGARCNVHSPPKLIHKRSGAPMTTSRCLLPPWSTPGAMQLRTGGMIPGQGHNWEGGSDLGVESEECKRKADSSTGRNRPALEVAWPQEGRSPL